MAWTAPRTWATNELVTAALLNTHVRDNLKHYGDTRYLPIPLSTAYNDAGTMSGFLATATIGVAKDDGVGLTNLTTSPYQSIIFPDSGTTGVAFNFHVPRDYGGSPVLKFQAYNAGSAWDGPKTAVFVAYVGIFTLTVADTIQANTGSTAGTGVGASYLVDLVGSITLTNTGGLAANASAALYLVRTPGAAGDDAGQDIGIIDIWLEYSPAA